MKRTIEQLTKQKERVYVVCHTTCVASKFLKDATKEGFTLGKRNPEDCHTARIFAVCGKEISYASGQTIQYFDSNIIKYDRIDYLKYICEEKDYYYHKGENNCIVIGNTEDIVFECNNQKEGNLLKVMDEDHHIIDCWKHENRHIIKNLNVGQTYIFEDMENQNKIEFEVKSKLDLKQIVKL